MEIRFSGFGGQGIIKAGILLGKAASLFDGKHATMNQSFGPEARGGACSAQVVILNTPILYPYITEPDIVVTMSQEAYEKFANDIPKGKTLLTDSDLVKPEKVPKSVNMYSVPATRIAENMGNRIFANVVMVGFLTAITEVVSKDAVKKALPGSVPDRFVERNIEAFERGYKYGIDLINNKKTTPKAKVKKKDKE